MTVMIRLGPFLLQLCMYDPGGAKDGDVKDDDDSSVNIDSGDMGGGDERDDNNFMSMGGMGGVMGGMDMSLSYQNNDNHNENDDDNGDSSFMMGELWEGWI